jgi:hypothetical protein
MFGIFLSSLGSFFVEISTSIGKYEVNARKESPYTMAFLNMFFCIAIFSVIVAVNPAVFVFNLLSLPTFGLRLILELVQTYFGVKSVIMAERSTATFILIVTIPLLLIVDLSLGYALSFFQLTGIVIIVLALIALFFKREIKKEGAHYSLTAAVNAVFTISLYKYDITHFNSVVGEQLVMTALLAVCLFFFAIYRAKENPLIFLEKPIFFIQSSMHGLGGIIESFAYGFAPASVIIAAKRSTAVFWAILSGSRYFHEKHVFLKLFLFVMLAAGLVLLVF